MTLVLGIDGGGTKTHALLADETGAVLGHATDGPSNWEAVGLRGAGDALREAVHKVLAAAERTVPEVSGAVFGLAGVDWPSDIPRLESVIEPLALPPGSCRVMNDSVIALRAGTARPGVVIIAGTGMVVAGRDSDGRTFRTLGLGPPLGDVGSASDVAAAAVRAVADAYVGRGPATTLTEHLCSLTGARSVEELLETFSRGGEPNLSAAPAVLRAAEDGDQVAMTIVTDTGSHLGKSAAVVAARLDLEPGYDLVLAGGLFRSASALLRSSLLEQTPGVHVVDLAAPPAAGAVMLALEEQGVTVDDALHKRVLEGASAVLPSSSA